MNLPNIPNNARLPVCLLCGMALLAGCQEERPVVEVRPEVDLQKTEDSEPASATSSVSFQQFRFAKPELRTRLLRFEEVAERISGPEFVVTSPKTSGNFVRRYWSKHRPWEPHTEFPEGVPREIYEITVRTIVVGEEAKTAGLIIDYVPETPDRWCVAFSFEDSVRQAVTGGGGWSVSFHQWDPEVIRQPNWPVRRDAKHALRVPVEYHPFGWGSVHLRSELSIDEQFLRYMSSAAAMKEAYLADSDELEKKFAETLRLNNFHKAVYGESDDGLPPMPEYVPVTEEEEQQALQAAKKEFDERRQLMRTYYTEMYSAWRDTFPYEECWPALDGN